eukprot:3931871-Rhodomonas_salina.2
MKAESSRARAVCTACERRTGFHTCKHALRSLAAAHASSVRAPVEIAERRGEITWRFQRPVHLRPPAKLIVPPPQYPAVTRQTMCKTGPARST